MIYKKWGKSCKSCFLFPHPNFRRGKRVHYKQEVKCVHLVVLIVVTSSK